MRKDHQLLALKVMCTEKNVTFCQITTQNKVLFVPTYALVFKYTKIT